VGHSICTASNDKQLHDAFGAKEMQVEFTNLHEKAVLLQILHAGRNPFGHHEHIG